MSSWSSGAAAADVVASLCAALAAFARDTERAEAIRAVKNLQYSYAQYAQFGLWAEMGALFSSGGETIWGDKTIKGPAAIAKYSMDTFGAGKPGLPAGVMNTMFIEVPLVNLSPDGNSAAAALRAGCIPTTRPCWKRASGSCGV
jgi:SnoaL-like domain